LGLVAMRRKAPNEGWTVQPWERVYVRVSIKCCFVRIKVFCL
jgi:hypothetical protein